jgi:hypothetical protein
MVGEPVETGNSKVPESGIVDEARTNGLDRQHRGSLQEGTEALDVSVVDGVLTFHFLFETGPRAVSVASGKGQLSCVQVYPAGQSG